MKSKITIVVILCVSIIGLKAQTFSQNELVLKTTNYKMDIKMDYDQNKLFSVCKMTIKNPSDKKVQTIPLLLYRLMKVTSIKNKNGNTIPFNQQVISFEDHELLQANYIEVNLETPLSINESKTIIIEYNGYLAGYTETGSSYVKDNISPEFTIIRKDCYAYPELGIPHYETNYLAGFENFTYTINVEVPDSLFVANGGKLINKTSNEGFTTYTYQNIKPAWRMDIAIANYNVLEWKNFTIYHFKEDSIGAHNVLEAAKESYELYRLWWGDLYDFNGFSIIEIPDDWGSQTDISCIIQTAATFKDPDNTIELYHEVSHFWNVKPSDDYSPRWNEGLAMFLQYHTEEILTEERRLQMATDWSFRKIKEDKRFKEIPLISFGKEGQTGLSYRMGIAMFHVLYDLVGKQKFNELIKKFYQEFYETGGSTEDFIRMAKDISSLNLDAFFNDWFYTTKYVEYVKSGYTVDDFIEQYN